MKLTDISSQPYMYTRMHTNEYMHMYIFVCTLQHRGTLIHVCVCVYEYAHIHVCVLNFLKIPKYPKTTLFVQSSLGKTTRSS